MYYFILNYISFIIIIIIVIVIIFYLVFIIYYFSFSLHSFNLFILKFYFVLFNVSIRNKIKYKKVITNKQIYFLKCQYIF